MSQQNVAMSSPDQWTRPKSCGEVTVKYATEADADYIVEAIDAALAPFYGGNHRAHARRLINTHLGGGEDARGLLSSRQLLLVLWQGNDRRGVLNLVFKRQHTCKISPLIVYPQSDETLGLGSTLLESAEEYARRHDARQLYCTVAERNRATLDFFRQHGFIDCGQSQDQYKPGMREVFLRKPLPPVATEQDRPSTISVTLVDDADWPRVRRLLADAVRDQVQGVTEDWLDSLRRGTGTMPHLDRAEKRPAWAYMAQDRSGRLRAAAIVSPKKGRSLKVMPLTATDTEGFEALIVDLPSLLEGKGRKAYIHLVPGSQEVALLQSHGWRLEAMLPWAYHKEMVTQQWAFPLRGDGYVRTLRIRHEYLRMIDEGRKTLEIRVAYEHLRSIKRGDSIRLLSSRGDVLCDVLGVRHYPSFVEMLQHEDSRRALPGVHPHQALRRLREIYPSDKERLGVIAIELRKANGRPGKK